MCFGPTRRTQATGIDNRWAMIQRIWNQYAGILRVALQIGFQNFPAQSWQPAGLAILPLQGIDD